MRMLLPRKAAVSNFVKVLAQFRFLTERISASEFETRPYSSSGSTYCFYCSKPSSNDVSRSLRDNDLDGLDIPFPMQDARCYSISLLHAHATWIKPNLTAWWIRTVHLNYSNPRYTRTSVHRYFLMWCPGSLTCQAIPVNGQWASFMTLFLVLHNQILVAVVRFKGSDRNRHLHQCYPLHVPMATTIR